MPSYILTTREGFLMRTYLRLAAIGIGLAALIYIMLRLTMDHNTALVIAVAGAGALTYYAYTQDDL